MFLSSPPQSAVDSDKIWHKLSWRNLQYNSLTVFQLTWIISLHYLVKLSIRILHGNSKWNCEPQNTPNVFGTVSTKPGWFLWNFVLIVLYIFATEYYKCFPPAPALSCETSNSCFVGENSNAGKAKHEKFYLLTLILLIQKDATFWLSHHVMAHIIRKTCTKLYQIWQKYFGCFFRFTVLTAVHLQNTNDKFHKVRQRLYSGEVVNVYISVRHIYSGQYVSNFITIDQWSGIVYCIS